MSPDGCFLNVTGLEGAFERLIFPVGIAPASRSFGTVPLALEARYGVMSILAYLSFWGKARPACSGRPTWHPAAYHCLDVAAVCARLLDLDPAIVADFAAMMQTEPAAVRTFLVLLAATHDIGKFSATFQLKVPERYPAILGVPPNLAGGDHTALGHRLLSDCLGAQLTALAPAIDKWAWPVLLSAVAGHHGKPVRSDPATEAEIGPAAIEAARHFLAATIEILAPAPFMGRIDDKLAKRLSWRLAGLFTLADWIGSNQAIFCYERPELTLRRYFDEVACPRAITAVERAGLSRPLVSAVTGYAALTGQSRPPSPLQVFAETMALPSAGPILALVEDMTGAGKTEAALILAHRLMQAGRADGLFVALPTMATANAMYNRLKDGYRRLFQRGETPSLVLAHGARHLDEGFRASILEVGDISAGSGPGDDDVTASAACAAWIADDRRKAFFADVGVGTIDQALLAVLPVKFAPLRLYGLSRRVLIVDEAHAYDHYMSEELGRLIRFHAAQGGSAIILSATLPEEKKRSIVEQFSLGARGHKPATAPFPSDYPLVTATFADGAVITTSVAPRPDLPRTVAVCRLADADAAFDEIERAARAGAAVAYIRNTVDDAIAAYDALTARGLDVLLFHARFAMVDRLAIERRVLNTFGPLSTPDARRGKILIATQVAEQSLDLDFDLMLSDLAPIDLMIQRAGRLWRHVRDNRPIDAARMLVVSPEPTDGADGEWYRRLFRSASYVYDNHALLWQSAAVLFAAGAIVSPAGVRPMIEAVYGRGALDGVPKGLEGRRLTAEGKAGAEKSMAKINLLDFASGYVPENGAWSSEIATPTRLGEARTILRLARIVDGQFRPWAPVEPSSDTTAAAGAARALDRAWALSEVSVRRYRVSARGRYDKAIEAAAAAIEAPWREMGSAAVLLPLIDDCGVPAARVQSGEAEKLREARLAYDPIRGVVFAVAMP
jgi:CRISPR-associated endonuclease/helicase Cas3